MARFFDLPENKYSQEELFAQAQSALMDVSAALIGLGCGRKFAERVVVNAAGDAKSPDAVSRAVRRNVSYRVIEREFAKNRKSTL
ncbi:hypothetical protein HY612_03730 [Candidatus Roizmanbacteria bacterium]|nr:hypothetical protein [Candidatus Roizmanbacteria bacterium]